MNFRVITGKLMPIFSPRYKRQPKRLTLSQSRFYGNNREEIITSTAQDKLTSTTKAEKEIQKFSFCKQNFSKNKSFVDDRISSYDFQKKSNPNKEKLNWLEDAKMKETQAKIDIILNELNPETNRNRFIMHLMMDKLFIERKYEGLFENLAVSSIWKALNQIKSEWLIDEELKDYLLILKNKLHPLLEEYRSILLKKIVVNFLQKKF
jgi:hypothetical protein